MFLKQVKDIPLISFRIWSACSGFALLICGFRPTLVTDFANAIPYYADLILKPDYADMTCPKPDNADHHYAPINLKYTPLLWGPVGLQKVFFSSENRSSLGHPFAIFDGNLSCGHCSSH